RGVPARSRQSRPTSRAQHRVQPTLGPEPASGAFWSLKPPHVRPRSRRHPWLRTCQCLPRSPDSPCTPFLCRGRPLPPWRGTACYPWHAGDKYRLDGTPSMAHPSHYRCVKSNELLEDSVKSTRHQRIIEVLDERGHTTVADLGERLSVSEMTI